MDDAEKKTPWKKNPLRELLREDILLGRISAGMKPAEAQGTRTEYGEGEMKKLFASRLKGMRDVIHREASTDGKSKKQVKWTEKNPVRIQMKQDVINGVIPDTMDFEIAYKLRAEYETGDMKDFALFKQRLTSLREIVSKAKARAKEDADALANDRGIHPRPPLNARGEVQWVTSEARFLLEIDVENKLHETLEPMELYLKRDAYRRDCPLPEVFRGHVHQEVKMQKWRNQWVDGKKEYALVPEPTMPSHDEE